MFDSLLRGPAPTLTRGVAGGSLLAMTDEIVEPGGEAQEPQETAQPVGREAQREALRAARVERREKSNAEMDKAVDAVLDAHGEPDDEDDLHAARAKDEEDEDAEEPEEELEASDAEEDGDDEADEDEDEPEDDEDALFNAQLTLRAAGVPPSVIKSTARATLIDWAERVSEQGKKGDGAAEPADTEPDDAASKSAKKGATAEPARAALPTWSEFSKLATDEFGASEDAVAKVFKPLHDAVGSLLEQNAEMVKQVTAANHAATQREGQAIVEREMTRLQGKYPALKRDEKMAKAILAEAKVLAAGLKATGEDLEFDALFDRAARNVAGRPKRSDLAQLKRNGVSPAPTSRFDRDRESSSEEDYWGSMADMVDAGASRERMMRLKPPPRKQKRQR